MLAAHFGRSIIHNASPAKTRSGLSIGFDRVACMVPFRSKSTTFRAEMPSCPRLSFGGSSSRIRSQTYVRGRVASWEA